jgi:hypothetical protein
MFRKQSVPTHQPEAEPTNYEGNLVCAPELCLASDPSQFELTRNEEIRLETMEDAATRLESSLEMAKGQASQLIQEFDDVGNRSHRNDIMQAPGRAGQRSSILTWRFAHKTVFGDRSDVIATIRQDAAKKIRDDGASAIGGGSISAALLHEDREVVGRLSEYAGLELRAFQRGGSTGYPVDVTKPYGEANYLKNPYYGCFLAQIQARAELAICMTEIPDVVREIFQPERLDDLPSHLKTLVAFDLLAGKDSLLQRFYGANNDQVKNSFFEYLVANDITPASKELAGAIALGAQAMGGCKCPANALGLCRDVTRKIDEDALPAAINDDMKKRESQSQQLRNKALSTFVKNVAISKWWDFTASIEPKKHQQEQYQEVHPKLQGHRPKSRAVTKALHEAGTNNLEASLERAIENEPQASLKVQVYSAGSEMLTHFISSEKSTVSAAADTVLADKMFAKYLSSHDNHESVQTTLQTAVETLFKAESFRDEPSIVRMSNIPAHRSRHDGAALPVWRISGQELSTGTGKVGRDIRIYFGMSTKGDTRRIEFIKVAHKSEVKKASQRNGFLR